VAGTPEARMSLLGSIMGFLKPFRSTHHLITYSYVSMFPLKYIIFIKLTELITVLQNRAVGQLRKKFPAFYGTLVPMSYLKQAKNTLHPQPDK
jgi:hypothetical protein